MLALKVFRRSHHWALHHGPRIAHETSSTPAIFFYFFFFFFSPVHPAGWERRDAWKRVWSYRQRCNKRSARPRSVLMMPSCRRVLGRITTLRIMLRLQDMDLVVEAVYKNMDSEEGRFC